MDKMEVSEPRTFRFSCSSWYPVAKLVDCGLLCHTRPENLSLCSVCCRRPLGKRKQSGKTRSGLRVHLHGPPTAPLSFQRRKLGPERGRDLAKVIPQAPRLPGLYSVRLQCVSTSTLPAASPVPAFLSQTPAWPPRHLLGLPDTCINSSPVF